MKSRSHEQVRAHYELLALGCFVTRAKEFSEQIAADPHASKEVKQGVNDHYLDTVEVHIEAKAQYRLRFGYRDNY